MPAPEPPALDSTIEADAPELDGLLQAARPIGDDNAVLAQARVAGRLFGYDVAGLGRFRVLDRLGRGGMGVVYAAYDPQLDRSVALKTVHVPTRGRDLAVQEAKALAKLSHPNIVPVFDVGVEADQVYIVMELVRGPTLREWVVGKPAHAVVEAYRQAGEALAAAHEAKLVHRDFKPDNAIVGSDGRVRVVDFGLACEAFDPEGNAVAPVHGIAGTPKYMAPEQRSGGAITAAADQYSFSIALAESLQSPLPNWIEVIVKRGCAEQPSQRFASMHELLRALSRDPVRRRRRRFAAAAVGTAVVGVVAAAVVGNRATGAIEPCAGGARELQATWPVWAQVTALTKIGGASPYGRALADLLARQMGDYRRRWATSHRAACLAQRAGEVSERIFERRMACLEQSRAAMGTVAQMTVSARAEDLPNLARAAQAIPDPERCRERAMLTTEIEPPPPLIAAQVGEQRENLARARVQIAAGNYGQARTVSEQVTVLARALGYQPLLAEALLVQGHSLLKMEKDAMGIPVLHQATSLGFAVHNDDLAVEAWARRAWLAAFQPSALAGVEVVTALAARGQAAFPRALLYNNIGGVELARGHRAAARAAYERAVQEAQHLTGADALELEVRQNLALTVDDAGQADALFVQARRDLARSLGEDHPDVLTVEFLRATAVLVPLPRVAATIAPICAAYELYPSLALRAAECWVELADVRLELRDRDAAVIAFDHAMRLGAATSEDSPEVSGYAAFLRGLPARAAAAFAAAAAQPLAADAEWRDRYNRATLMLGLGRARAAQGMLIEARTALQSAVAELEPIWRARPVVAVERRLGRAHAELAKVLARLGHDPSPSAEQALAWFTRCDAPAEVAELQRLVRN